jgi:hypothetical protein
MRDHLPTVLAAVALAWLPSQGAAQESRLDQIERRVQRLEQNAGLDDSLSRWTSTYFVPGLAILATGAFCALWARSTGRDPWLWLAAGLLFTVFALIAVAQKNEEDKKAKKKCLTDGWS